RSIGRSAVSSRAINRSTTMKIHLAVTSKKDKTKERRRSLIFFKGAAPVLNKKGPTSHFLFLDRRVNS
ncbi:hypothetical protein, partial [Paenibacillus periandrae]|uniref:hypothetical protein n=1 Tax=Paenibacillus periandrae TaxID=1761741 RepID=UPI001F092833